MWRATAKSTSHLKLQLQKWVLPQGHNLDNEITDFYLTNPVSRLKPDFHKATWALSTFIFHLLRNRKKKTVNRVPTINQIYSLQGS